MDNIFFTHTFNSSPISFPLYIKFYKMSVQLMKADRPTSDFERGVDKNGLKINPNVSAIQYSPTEVEFREDNIYAILPLSFDDKGC